MRCANCGNERSGRYCARCGQNDRDYHRALPPLLWELIREAFEVDSRLWRTLKLLIAKPGELALEFSRNRRASYVSPIRLYLFVSIAFFFFLSLTTDVMEPENQETIRTEVERMKDTDTAPLMSLLGPERQQRALEILGRPETSFARSLLLELAEAVAEDPPTSGVVIYLIERLVDALHEPQSMFQQFMDNLALGVFVMLPAYAGLLKLFYFRERRYYVEHLVFATQLHTFTFLVFGFQLVLPTGSADSWMRTVADQLETALLLWLGVYHYLALRRYYGQGRLLTAAKFSLLMIFYAALLTPTALLFALAITVVRV